MTYDEAMARLQHLHTIVCTCPIGCWTAEVNAAYAEYFELRLKLNDSLTHPMLALQTSI